MSKYYVWYNFDTKELPKVGIKINIKSWYPAFIVGWITRYKIWRHG